MEMIAKCPQSGHLMPLWKLVTSVSSGCHLVSHETTQYSALLLTLYNDRFISPTMSKNVLYYTGTMLHDDESAFAISRLDHACSLVPV
jgi:hypothetical protein